MRSVVVCLLSLGLIGCGGFLQSGRALNYQAAEALASTDRAVAPEYRKASEEALDASQSLEEYEQRMEPWNRLEEALRASYEALKAFQAALDAYEAGSEGNVLRVILDVLEALQRVVDTLSALGLDEVNDLADLIRDLRQFFSQTGGN